MEKLNIKNRIMKTKLQSYESMLKNAFTKKDKEIAKLLIKGEKLKL